MITPSDALFPVVYFLSNPQRELIKIGTTRNLAMRCKVLCQREYTKLAYLGSLPGDADLENSIHLKFADLWVSDEWFCDDTALRDYISQQAQLEFSEVAKAQNEARMAAKLEWIAKLERLRQYEEDEEIDARMMPMYQYLADSSSVSDFHHEMVLIAQRRPISSQVEDRRARIARIPLNPFRDTVWMPRVLTRLMQDQDSFGLLDNRLTHTGTDFWRDFETLLQTYTDIFLTV